jgi:Fe-S-cluster containining protein
MSDSMCDGCHGGCCRAFAVPITGADIIRIEGRLSLDFWEFVCRWADPSSRIARNAAPHFFFEDEPQTPFVICLKHESSIHSGTTRCRFLVESVPDAAQPLGTARCGIYESRPTACRSFPGRLSDDREIVILSDLSQETTRSGNRVYELCPRPWTPQDVDPIQLTQDLVVMQHELRFFQQIATVWNRTPRPWAVFPDFLRDVYQRRVVTETSQDVDQELVSIPFPQSPQVDSRAA